MTVTETPSGLKVFRKDIYFQKTGYDPHPGQWAIHLDPTRHKVVCNGRRWGKTLLGGKETECTAFVKNRFGEPMRGWIVGPQFDDCEKEFRVVYDTFQKLGIDKLSSRFVNNPDNGNMHIKTNWGFDLECRSAKHPETLVGEGLDFVLMVEAGRHKRRSWAQYIRPTLSDKRGTSLHTGVPEGSSSDSLLYHLWQRGQDESKRSWKSWRMPSWTNTVVFPGGRTDPEILEAQDDLTQDEFDRQYGAQFVERVGRVMSEWDDEVHLADLEYNPAWPTYFAIDYGYTNDWVLLVIQVDEWNNVYVIKENRWRIKDTDTIADEILTDPVLGPLSRAAICFYPDPAAPDDTMILSRKLKLPARGNTGGDINPRMKLIRKALKLQNEHLEDGDPLKRPSLLVDRECIQLAWEMREGYRWPERQSDVKNDSEIPMDKDNHGPEALSRFFKGHLEPMDRIRGTRQRRAKMKRG